MSFGDDYLYSFVWPGQSMFIPLPEGAVRVSSWHDLFLSQWSHYFTWGGRTVAHVIAQFFLWIGKGVFNVFNSVVAIILVVEIYWFIYRGRVSLKIKPKTVFWIFFMLWAFAPGFTQAFFWLTAACNYLWTYVILLSFLLPYIRKYYFFSKIFNGHSIFSFFMFLSGIIAGWTNENSVCWIILALMAFVLKNRTCINAETWMFTGLAGLCAGYLLLILAPGNMVRLYSEHGSNWFGIIVFKHNISILAVVLTFQLFMWYFCLKSIHSIYGKNIQQNVDLRADILLIKILLFISFGMSAIMLFSPEFPLRSGFFGTVPLVISTGILLRMQKEYSLEFIKPATRKFLFYLGLFYFTITSAVTLFNFYEKHCYMTDILTSIQQMKKRPEERVLIFPPFREVSFRENLFSGLHVPNYNLTDNENDWRNVSVSRYYGIKGIHTIQTKKN